LGKDTVIGIEQGAERKEDKKIIGSEDQKEEP
jgi:hypothetical protein